MKDKLFGKQRTPVSEVGIGCWQFSSEWGDLTDADAEKILETAVENGITFIDTADVYGMGRSESIIGKFIGSRKEALFIATKIGRRPEIYPDRYTRAQIEAHIDGCLQRLGLESLHLVQLHCIPTAEMEKGEIFEILEEMKAKGKIQRYGASVETTEEALTCLKVPGLDSLQIIFNVFRQKPIEAVLKKAAEKNVAIIARVPLASGLLSGKFTPESRFPENDHRNFNRDGAAFNVGETFAGVEFSKGLELAEEIKQLCPPDMTLAQMSLRWILDFDEITTVIPGASSVRQAKENAAVSALPSLDAQTHSELKKLYEEKIHALVRGKY